MNAVGRIIQIRISKKRTAMSEYQVEHLLQRRVNKFNKFQYLVKWVGYPQSQCTWEPTKNLTSCRNLIQSFDQNLARKLPKGKPNKNQCRQNKKIIDYFKKPSVISKIIINQNQIQKLQQLDNTILEQVNLTKNNKSQLQPVQISNATQQENKKMSDLSAIEHIETSIENNTVKTEKEDSQQLNKYGNKFGELTSSIEILGIFRKNNELYYSMMMENGEQITMERKVLIQKDPLAILLFYEKHLKYYPKKMI